MVPEEYIDTNTMGSSSSERKNDMVVQGTGSSTGQYQGKQQHFDNQQQQTALPPPITIQSYLMWKQREEGSSQSHGVQYNDIRGLLGTRSSIPHTYVTSQQEPPGEYYSMEQASNRQQSIDMINLDDMALQEHEAREYVCPDVALFDSALTANEYLKSTSSWVSDDDDDSDEYDKENQCVYRLNTRDRTESGGDLEPDSSNNENDYGLLNPSPAFSDDDMQSSEVYGYDN